MVFKERFIVKGDIPDNAEAVGNDAEFEGIAEWPLMYICRIAGFAAVWGDMEP